MNGVARLHQRSRVGHRASLTPEQAPTTPQEPNQQTYKPNAAASQLQMFMMKEEVTVNELDSLEGDRTNQLECNSIEN